MESAAADEGGILGPVQGPIDHERISVTEDRSWTFALLDQALSPATADADRDKAFRTLACLEDYRSVAPLTAAVEDPHAPEAVRSGASAVLRGFEDTSTSARRRDWWATGDPVLAKHALGLMTRHEADIVVAVARDDSHPLQAVALGSMAFGYGEPQFQPVKIRALAHPDPLVREAAADVLLWDEPVAAEEALLGALQDSSTAVVAAAVDTLQYYASRRALRTVSTLLDAPDEDVRAMAVESFDCLRGSFEAKASEGDAAEVRLLREWMEPVRDLVRWPDEIQPPDRGSSRTAPARRRVSEHELHGMVSDPDGEWGSRKKALRNIDWSAYGQAERDRLARLLVRHPEPVVRASACSGFSGWGRAAELLTLTSDASLGVRKTAMYHLGLVPRDRSLAEFAWSCMTGENGTTGDEVLVTYVAHAPAEEATMRLVEMAVSDQREVVVARAVGLLVDLEARRELSSLLPMLDEEPGVTWEVHIALLDAIRKLDLPRPPLDHLAEVDNLHLVRAVIAVSCE